MLDTKLVYVYTYIYIFYFYINIHICIFSFFFFAKQNCRMLIQKKNKTYFLREFSCHNNCLLIKIVILFCYFLNISLYCQLVARQ